jgi:hypothetical protein
MAERVLELRSAVQALRRRDFARALVLSTGVLTLLPSFVVGRPPIAAAAPSTKCAWPVAVSITTSNVLAPDSNAAYWLQPFVVQSGLRITLSGRYPDARYASFSVYDSATHAFTSHGVYSALADYQIAPDRGSVNPWQQQAAAGGHFTLTLRTDVASHQANTLPLAPPGSANGRPGYLVYRIYLPAGGNVKSVPLPTLTFQQGSTSRTVQVCPHPRTLAAGGAPAATPGPNGDAAATPTPTPGRVAASKQLQFYRPSPRAAGNVFPDADDAPMVALVVPPAPADVVVVTAKAPTAPSGDHPVLWPARGEDLRYWSLCTIVGTVELPTVANPLPNGTTDYGCRDNDATKLDAAGYYFYVIGRESQRAVIIGISGVTFLPFSTAQTRALHVLYLRGKLANPDFAYAVQRVTQYGNPAAAAAITGPYYPRAAVCPLSTLTAKGPQACLAHP